MTLQEDEQQVRTYFTSNYLQLRQRNEISTRIGQRLNQEHEDAVKELEARLEATKRKREELESKIELANQQDGIESKIRRLRMNLGYIETPE